MDKLPDTRFVDACILFSFFNNNSDRRRLIEELPNRGCRLVSPKFALKELSSNGERIKKYAKINDLGFAFLLSLLEKKIESYPYESYASFMQEANSISPHGEETVDDPYFALALSLNASIWSDETAFKKQASINVYNTNELFNLLSKKEP
jgi:predicted nucleic acid-binding protein